jgi:hypothetical protein
MQKKKKREPMGMQMRAGRLQQVMKRTPQCNHTAGCRLTYTGLLSAGKGIRLTVPPRFRIDATGYHVPTHKRLFGLGVPGVERPLMCEMLAIDTHNRLSAMLGAHRFNTIITGDARTVVTPQAQGERVRMVTQGHTHKQMDQGEWEEWYAGERRDVLGDIPEGCNDVDILEDNTEQKGACRVGRILHHLAVRARGTGEKVTGGVRVFFLVQWAQPFDKEVTWEPACNMIQARDCMIRYRAQVLGLPEDFTFENSVAG